MPHFFEQSHPGNPLIQRNFPTLVSCVSATILKSTTSTLFKKHRGYTPLLPKMKLRRSSTSAPPQLSERFCRGGARSARPLRLGTMSPRKAALPPRLAQSRNPPPPDRFASATCNADPPRPFFDCQLSTANSPQIFCSFHFPRRNRITPAMATTVSATTIEMYTPFCCKCV